MRTDEGSRLATADALRDVERLEYALSEMRRLIASLEDLQRRHHQNSRELIAYAGRLRSALGEAGVLLEVLAGQIRVKPYAEMTADFQGEVLRVTALVRASLRDEPRVDNET